jgi:beta-N-acetylhexosaminidase
VQQLHEVRSPRLLIAVDHEGGRVQRFRDGFTSLPAAAHFGQVYEQDPNQARHLAELAGWLMAVELRAVGIDFSFAPVLDVDHGVSEVIGDRAFHSDPAVVTELARAYIKGMHEAGMASVGKHFPGHGAVAADSHHDLPEDTRVYADLEMEDMIPFQRLSVNGMNGVMVAHVLYSQIDSQPAGFSEYWLRGVLRRTIGFQGVIFSDDLSMGGAEWAGDYVQRAQLALNAGCDMVLVCNQPEHAAKVVESLSDYHDPAAQLRLARMHGKTFPEPRALKNNRRWREAIRLMEHCESELWLDMDLE